MNEREMQKKYPKPLKDLTLLDRFLFDTAMSKPDICHNILSIIFGEKEIPPIKIRNAEKALEPYYDSRAVRLDLLAVDEADTVYDAEAQQKNKGYRVICRRSRYYQAHVDVNLLKPGELDFGKLNDAYVIFICPFDIFGYGKYRYTFRMACEEVPGLFMNDGAARIFLNTHGENEEEVSEELVEFLHYVEKTTDVSNEIQSPRVKQLVNQIDELKDDQETGVKYMRLWEEIEYYKADAREEGLEEGRAEGRAEGREEGRAEGRAEGREEGRAEGRAEGRVEGRAEGRVEGRAEGQAKELIRIIRINLKKNKRADELADILGESETRVQLIMNLLTEHPEADDAGIFEIIREQMNV